MWISKNTKPFTDEQIALFNEYRAYGAKVAARFLDGRTTGGPEFCDDMKSAAMIGLLCAAQRYDPACGRTFGKYAAQRIKAAMLTRTYENDTGSVSTTSHKARKRIRQEMAARTPRPPVMRGNASDTNDYDTDKTIGVGYWSSVGRRDSYANVVDVDDVLRAVHPGPRRLLERVFLEGASREDIADEEGCGIEHVRKLVREGIAQARYALRRKDLN